MIIGTGPSLDVRPGDLVSSPVGLVRAVSESRDWLGWWLCEVVPQDYPGHTIGSRTLWPVTWLKDDKHFAQRRTA
jgi:hypothetical protein